VGIYEDPNLLDTPSVHAVRDYYPFALEDVWGSFGSEGGRVG
jgi:hypothetical protein